MLPVDLTVDRRSGLFCGHVSLLLATVSRSHRVSLKLAGRTRPAPISLTSRTWSARTGLGERCGEPRYWERWPGPVLMPACLRSGQGRGVVRLVPEVAASALSSAAQFRDVWCGGGRPDAGRVAVPAASRAPWLYRPPGALGPSSARSWPAPASGRGRQ